MIALRWSSVVGIAPVLLTRRFSLPQMFSNMFKSGDLDGKSTTFTLFAFMRCSGGPCTMGWSTSVQQLHSSVVFQQWNDHRIQHFMLIVKFPFMKTMLVL